MQSQTQIGRTLVAKRIGSSVVDQIHGDQGATSVVLDGHNLPTGFDVVTKVGLEEGLDELILQEVAILRQIGQNPYNEQIIEAGFTQEGKPYETIRRIDGPNLHGLLEEITKANNTNGKVYLDDALAIMAQAATGLDAAHTASFIHRDVKPGNIMVQVDRSLSEKPKIHTYVIDYACAQPTDRAQTVFKEKYQNDEDMLRDTAFTPDYAAPEQMSGLARPYSDNFSLGLVFGELLHGYNPRVKVSEERIYRDENGQTKKKTVKKMTDDVKIDLHEFGVSESWRDEFKKKMKADGQTVTDEWMTDFVKSIYKSAGDLITRMTSINPEERPNTNAIIHEIGIMAASMRINPYDYLSGELSKVLASYHDTERVLKEQMKIEREGRAEEKTRHESLTTLIVSDDITHAWLSAGPELAVETNPVTISPEFKELLTKWYLGEDVLCTIVEDHKSASSSQYAVTKWIEEAIKSHSISDIDYVLVCRKGSEATIQKEVAAVEKETGISIYTYDLSDFRKKARDGELPHFRKSLSDHAHHTLKTTAGRRNKLIESWEIGAHDPEAYSDRVDREIYGRRKKFEAKLTAESVPEDYTVAAWMCIYESDAQCPLLDYYRERVVEKRAQWDESIIAQALHEIEAGKDSKEVASVLQRNLQEEASKGCQNLTGLPLEYATLLAGERASQSRMQYAVAQGLRYALKALGHDSYNSVMHGLLGIGIGRDNAETYARKIIDMEETKATAKTHDMISEMLQLSDTGATTKKTQTRRIVNNFKKMEEAKYVFMALGHDENAAEDYATDALRMSMTDWMDIGMVKRTLEESLTGTLHFDIPETVQDPFEGEGLSTSVARYLEDEKRKMGLLIDHIAQKDVLPAIIEYVVQNERVIERSASVIGHGREVIKNHFGERGHDFRAGDAIFSEAGLQKFLDVLERKILREGVYTVEGNEGQKELASSAKQVVGYMRENADLARIIYGMFDEEFTTVVREAGDAARKAMKKHRHHKDQQSADGSKSQVHSTGTNGTQDKQRRFERGTEIQRVVDHHIKRDELSHIVGDRDKAIMSIAEERLKAYSWISKRYEGLDQIVHAPGFDGLIETLYHHRDEKKRIDLLSAYVQRRFLETSKKDGIYTNPDAARNLKGFTHGGKEKFRFELAGEPSTAANRYNLYMASGKNEMKIASFTLVSDRVGDHYGFRVFSYSSDVGNISKIGDEEHTMVTPKDDPAKKMGESVKILVGKYVDALNNDRSFRDSFYKKKQI